MEMVGNSEVSSSGNKGGTAVLEWRVLSEGVTVGLVQAVDCRPQEMWVGGEMVAESEGKVAKGVLGDS